MKTQTVLHYPRLDTVLMVEDAIKKAPDYPTKMKLWKSLPKKVQYQTFNVILRYLSDSSKILFTKDNKIVWVFADTPKARKLIEESVPIHASNPVFSRVQ
jgi:mannose/fructose/N-acetylgalactosamine-specific phosphotransferase system component IIB